MTISENAPIIIFAFNRVDFLKATIESLKANNEAKDSVLFVFVDGPRTNKEGETEDVNQVKAYVETVSGFKSVTYFFSEINKGLADSIIDGVTLIINKYGSVIVLEDDLYVSRSFLNYMNTMLAAFKNDMRIMQIAGFGTKINIPKSYRYDIYLNRRATSWSWATWKDRWETIDWEVKDYEDLKSNRKKQREFNKLGSDLYEMIKGYMQSTNNSWAVRFCYSMFNQGKFAISPIKSLVRNDGFGTEATHCSGYNRFKIDCNDFQEKFSFSDNLQWNKSIDRSANKYWSYLYRFYGKAKTAWRSCKD